MGKLSYKKGKNPATWFSDKTNFTASRKEDFSTMF